MSKDRLEFKSYDGLDTIRLGQGQLCVLLQVESPRGYAGVVLTDTEAEAMGRSLLRRARYSRRSEAPA